MIHKNHRVSIREAEEDVKAEEVGDYEEFIGELRAVLEKPYRNGNWHKLNLYGHNIL